MKFEAAQSLPWPEWPVHTGPELGSGYARCWAGWVMLCPKPALLSMSR